MQKEILCCSAKLDTSSGQATERRSKYYIYSVETNFQDDQAPVIQPLDSAIHRINHYPADKYYGNQLRYPLDRDLSGG